MTPRVDQHYLDQTLATEPSAKTWRRACPDTLTNAQLLTLMTARHGEKLRDVLFMPYPSR